MPVLCRAIWTRCSASAIEQRPDGLQWSGTGPSDPDHTHMALRLTFVPRGHRAGLIDVLEQEEEDGTMRIEHQGKSPRVHESVYVAPNATICGDVTIGANSRILFGAVLVAEGGPVVIGSHCIIMENAVIRGTPRHPTHLGDHVLVGPRAYLSGCTVKDSAFMATGAAVFNGAVIGTRAEVRINGTVHLKTNLPPDATVPIGWIAVGDPAKILPPDEHDRIWAVQEPLDFPGTVFGLERADAGDNIMPELTRRYARYLGRHCSDRILERE